MPRRRSIYFPNLLALVILALAPFSGHIWFVLPVAVSLLSQSKSLLMRLIPWMALMVTGFIAFGVRSVLTELDALSLVLFFMEGLCLRWIVQNKSSPAFSVAILFPLLISALLGLIVWKSSSQPIYLDWANSQIQSDVFPYFFRVEDWPESLLEFYQIVLLPIMRAGLIGWFACTIAMAFFMNAIMENVLRSINSKKTLKPKVWEEFNRWKAPDFILPLVVLGLACLAVDRLFSLNFTSLQIWGWNITILALFPIFIQGIAVASFFIPRVSMIVFVIIFTLLVIKPIPVLMLAGLGDLWFDFRSKMRSDPSN